MRLIDADAIPEVSWDPLEERAFRKIIEEQPTIEAEPVRRGRWEDIDYLFSKCSVCGGFFDTFNYTANYCPNCGAKMEA